MKVFISGGAKNGKSLHAQGIARRMARINNKPLYYVATMRPCDDEDKRRIERHRQERSGWGFETLEQSESLVELLEKSGVDLDGVFLLDSITALLANEMFKADGTIDFESSKRVAKELKMFIERVGGCVIVSDYIFGDLVPDDPITVEFMKGLALCDRSGAKSCDVVCEAFLGRLIYYRNDEL